MKKDKSKFSKAQGGLITALLSRIGGDGHTIWKPTILNRFPAELRARFVRNYKSDGSPKGSITVTGQPVDELCGVYGLDVLRCIASDLGLPGSSKMGRGFEARELTDQISAFFAKRADKTGFRYMVKAPRENILLSAETFSYKDAKTKAAQLGGIVTSESWGRKNCALATV